MRLEGWAAIECVAILRDARQGALLRMRLAYAARPYSFSIFAARATSAQRVASPAMNAASSARRDDARLHAERLELRLDIRHRQHVVHRLVDLIGDRGRRAGRRDDRKPRARREIAQARFAQGRHLREQLRPLGRGDGENFRLAAAMHRHRRAEIVEEQIDIAGENVGQRRAGAAVGHVHHLGAGLLREHHAGQMRGRAGPCEA